MDYVISVAEERSMSRAAKKLHVTQQTLSAHIASIERELGAQLFIRHTPLELTYAGEEFLQYAKTIQKQIRELKVSFSEITGNEKGLLKLGITDNRDRIILLPIMREFAKNHPKIVMKVIEVPVKSLTQKLLDDELDICISNFEGLKGGFFYKDLYQEQIIFLIRKDVFKDIYKHDHRKIIQMVQTGSNYLPLQECPLILGHEEDIAGQFSRQIIKNFVLQPNIKAEAENMAFILDLCIGGLGGCFCPDIIAKNTLTPQQLDKMLILPLGPKASYTMRIGWKKQWSIIDTFIQTALEQNFYEQTFTPN